MNVEIENVGELTPHEKALMEAGEDLLKSSVSTSRDFCKSMISIAISAVPIELALMKLFIGKEQIITTHFGQFWFGPIVITLLSACIFTVGYHPGRGIISLENLDDIESFLTSVSNRRFYAGLVGFILLLLGVSWAVCMLAGV